MTATTKIDNISETKKRIHITVPETGVSKYKNKALQKVGQSAKINGFRPGKIPQAVIEKHYGAEINYECVNFLITETFSKALEEHKLNPLGEPKFDAGPLSSGDYSYSIEIEVRPNIALKDYKNIKIKKKTAEITTKEVDDELKQLQESLAQLAPADESETLKSGLVATIDFEGTLEGQKFEGGTAKDYVFEVGKGQLLAEFETKIEGMKNGDKRDIEITFPADYFEKKLAGKNAQYKITLKNLHLKNIPALDDELAKDIGKENLEQVKTEIRDALIKRKEQEFRGGYAEEVQTKLLKDHKFEVPEKLLEAEVERRKEEKDKVTDQIKMQLILEEIAKIENITATPQDLDTRFKMLSQMYRQPVQEIKKIYVQNNLIGSLISQITLDKALDFVIDNAKMD